MGMYDKFQTDPDMERKGVLIDYGDFRVRLARAGGANKKFQRLLEYKSRPFQRAIQSKSMDTDAANLLMKEVYAEACVTDWEIKVEGEWKQGIEPPPEAESKDLLPFTAKNVLETLKRLNDIFLDFQEMGAEMHLYKVMVNEENSEN